MGEPSGLIVSRTGRLVLMAKAVRAFAFGWLSVILALYLARRGFVAAEIGAVFTATMVEDAAPHHAARRPWRPGSDRPASWS